MSSSITVENGGERLDVFLTHFLCGEYTRSQITNAIKSGTVLLNGNAVKAGTILRTSDIIEYSVDTFSIQHSALSIPEDIPLNVVFEDKYLMIIDKPRGLVVHPGAGNRSGTLLNGLLYRASYGMSSLDAPQPYASTLTRGGIVHRLDKNTAGLMVVAKTAAVQAKLAAMFEKHEVKRTYIGLVEGTLDGEGTVDVNIIRDTKHRTLFTTLSSSQKFPSSMEGCPVRGGVVGRHAVTHYKSLKHIRIKNHDCTLVEFQLETGRTHQIRVHCKHIGHPIVGDPEYNPRSKVGDVSGQLLDSVKIEFVHPITGATVRHEKACSFLLTTSEKK